MWLIMNGVLEARGNRTGVREIFKITGMAKRNQGVSFYIDSGTSQTRIIYERAPSVMKTTTLKVKTNLSLCFH
jgi:hypothetical protein